MFNTCPFHFEIFFLDLGFLGGSEVKNLPANAEDVDSILGLRRYSEERNGYPFQYSCLENPKDTGAWWAAIYGVAQSQTRLKRLNR